MYGALWRRLPGPALVRALLALALLVGVVLLLFTVVFPAVGPLLPFSDVTVNQPRPAPGG